MQQTNKEQKSSKVSSISTQQDMKTAIDTIGKHTHVTENSSENVVKNKQEKSYDDGFERDKMYKTSYGTPVDERKDN